MCPTDFCQPLFLPEPVPALSASDLAWSASPKWAVRSKGPSFHDALDPLRRAVRQRGRLLAVTSVGVNAPHDSSARSVHDFVSDISSPSGSRFRLLRSACVGSVGSRPFLPGPVKGTVCHDPRRLPSTRRRLIARSSSPFVSCDDARVVHHSLAARSAFRHSNGKRRIGIRSLQHDTVTRGHAD